MFQVVKRDGELDEFKMGKITAAIDKAFDAKGKNYSSDMIDLLGLRVTADFQNKIENNRISVEDIQDSVENVLIQAGYSDVAKAYILLTPAVSITTIFAGCSFSRIASSSIFALSGQLQ